MANVFRYFNSDHFMVHLPISLCNCGDSSLLGNCSQAGEEGRAVKQWLRMAIWKV